MSNLPGKIYRIDCAGKFYYGSTCADLDLRLAQHRINAEIHPNRKIYAHINAAGWPHAQISLVEDYPCASRTALIQRENFYVRQYINDANCLNVQRPIGLLPSEWRELNRQKIRDIQNKKFKCRCGGSFTRANKAAHERSYKHIDYLSECRRLINNLFTQIDLALDQTAQ